MAVEFYEEWYKNLINHSNEKFLLVEKIADLIGGKKYESCLEIGLGTSFFFAENLSHLFQTYTVIEENTFDAEIPKNVKLLAGDFELVEISEKFDVIIASHVVYYFDDLKKSIEKMFDLLNEGGKIYFVVNGRESDYGAVKNAFSRFIGKPYVFTYDILKKELEEYKIQEYTTQASLHFSSIEDLYNTLKLSFDLYPNEYKEQKENMVHWLTENIQGDKFFIDQKIFEVTK